MFKDEVESSKIDYVLQPYSDNYTSSTENNQADYKGFESDISRQENAKTDKNDIYSKIIKAPRSLFYKLQDKSVLAPDTSFKSKPTPWYKKAVAAISK